jgi:hypothetical protein
MNTFLNINYLKTGTLRQQEAHQELIGLEIIEELQEYVPLLAGTIPIGIDVPGSDLDIICYCTNHESFSTKLIDLYAHRKDFTIETKQVNGIITTIANFEGTFFPIEIFGQTILTHKQDAFKHMLIEYKILKKKDSIFTKKIIHLKKSGLKTEPAFAKLLGLKGNPYIELLKYK